MDRKRWAFPLVGVAAARFGDETRLALAGVGADPVAARSPEALDDATPLAGQRVQGRDRPRARRARARALARSRAMRAQRSPCSPLLALARRAAAAATTTSRRRRPRHRPADRAGDTTRPTCEPVAAKAKPDGGASARRTSSTREDLQLVVETNCGNFTITLDQKPSPKTAASFVALASDGFFDDTIFHRIVPGFVIQGGDPTGDRHRRPRLHHGRPAAARHATYTKGVVAMAKTGAEPPGTAGSQFFVVTGRRRRAAARLRGPRQGHRRPRRRRRIGTLGDPATEQPTQPVVDREDHASTSELMIAAVVLAAGAATRFGSPKQRLLLPARARRACARARSTTSSSSPARTELDTDARSCTAPTGSAGPGASLRCGLARARRRVEAAVVVLADGPTSRPRAIDRVVAAWRESGRRLVAASYGGDRGHPVLLARAAWATSRTRARARSSRCSSRATTSALQATSIRPMIGRRTPASRRNETPAWSSQPHSTADARRSRRHGSRASSRSARPPPARGADRGRGHLARGGPRLPLPRRPTTRCSRCCSTRPRSRSTTARRASSPACPSPPRPFDARTRAQARRARCSRGRGVAHSSRARRSRAREQERAGGGGHGCRRGQAPEAVADRGRRAATAAGTSPTRAASRPDRRARVPHRARAAAPTASTTRRRRSTTSSAARDVAERLARRSASRSMPLPGGKNPSGSSCRRARSARPGSRSRAACGARRASPSAPGGICSSHATRT